MRPRERGKPCYYWRNCRPESHPPPLPEVCAQIVAPFALATLFILACFPAAAGELTGVIEYVQDGDTIKINGERIRLEGIDAPELSQAYGRKAQEFLADIEGKRATVIYDERDRYGRILGTVYYLGTDLNRLMIERGFAWHYVAYSDDPELAAAEREARREKRGLWEQVSPVPPWKYRRK